MTILSTHKKQAEHNEKLAKSLLKTPHFDWAITCAFYSAIHYVEAKFTTYPDILHTEVKYEQSKEIMRSQDANVSIHEFREMQVGFKLNRIRNQYSHLKVSSDIARYLKNTQDKTAFEYFHKETVKKIIQGLDDIKEATC